MRLLPLLSLALAFTASATGSLTPVAAQGTEVFVERRSYSIGARDTIEPVLINGTDRTVYVATPSDEDRLERWEAGAWTDVGRWYNVMRYGPGAMAVLSGKTRNLIPLALALDRQYRRDLVCPGIYRIKTTVYASAAIRPWMGTVHSTEVASAPFAVVE